MSIYIGPRAHLPTAQAFSHTRQKNAKPSSQDDYIGKPVKETDLLYFDELFNLAYHPRTGVLYTVKAGKVFRAAMLDHNNLIPYKRKDKRINHKSLLKCCYEIANGVLVGRKHHAIARDGDNTNSCIDNIALIDQKAFTRYKSAVKNLAGEAKMFAQENQPNKIWCTYLVAGKKHRKLYGDSLSALMMIEKIKKYSTLVIGKYVRSA